MDSFDRVYAALKGELVDRIPILPHIGDHAGIIDGLTFDMMYKNVKKASEAHLKALSFYGYDITNIQVEPSWPVAEACGAEIFYPKDKNPWITKYPIESKEDLESLEVLDFMESLGTRVMIEGTQLLVDNADVPIAAYMTGPITFSFQLMPYEKLIIQMIKDPDFTQKLVSRSVLIIKKYLKALKNAGASILVLCEHDFQMLKPELIQEFSINYIPDILKSFNYNILHICGKVKHHLNYLRKDILNIRKLDMINIGPFVKIDETLDLFKHEIGVAGNIDHVKLLPMGTLDEIEAAVHDAIRQSHGDPRFILSPGCEITADTPVDNVKAFIKSIATFNNYNNEKKG